MKSSTGRAVMKTESIAKIMTL